MAGRDGLLSSCFDSTEQLILGHAAFGTGCPFHLYSRVVSNEWSSFLFYFYIHILLHTPQDWGVQRAGYHQPRELASPTVAAPCRQQDFIAYLVSWGKLPRNVCKLGCHSVFGLPRSVSSWDVHLNQSRLRISAFGWRWKPSFARIDCLGAIPTMLEKSGAPVELNTNQCIYLLLSEPGVQD